ncbi:MAG: hypothetical protein H6Q60_8 [Oscillospiraceae bacterium]|nr:hypothetical protein [Oscillospiraceae bacterium]
MLQLIANESPKTLQHLNLCLEEIRSILMNDFYEQNGYDASIGTFRMGSLILIPIQEVVPFYRQLNISLQDKDDQAQSLQMLKRQLKYLTSYIYEEFHSGVQFSLYTVERNIESYYLGYGFLPMRIGSYDWYAYSKYNRQLYNG